MAGIGERADILVILLLWGQAGTLCMLKKHSTTELGHSPEKFWLIWFGDLREGDQKDTLIFEPTSEVQNIIHWAIIFVL